MWRESSDTFYHVSSPHSHPAQTLTVHRLNRSLWYYLLVHNIINFFLLIIFNFSNLYSQVFWFVHFKIILLYIIIIDNFLVYFIQNIMSFVNVHVGTCITTRIDLLHVAGGGSDVVPSHALHWSSSVNVEHSRMFLSAPTNSSRIYNIKFY